MKKLLSLVLALTMVAGLLAGCGSKEPVETTTPKASVEGTMEELLNKVIEIQPVEFMGSTMALDLTKTDEEGLWQIKSFTGLEDASQIVEAAAYEPMIGSIAFSMEMTMSPSRQAPVSWSTSYLPSSPSGKLSTSVGISLPRYWAFRVWISALSTKVTLISAGCSNPSNSSTALQLRRIRMRRPEGIFTFFCWFVINTLFDTPFHLFMFRYSVRESLPAQKRPCPGRWFKNCGAAAPPGRTP